MADVPYRFARNALVQRGQQPTHRLGSAYHLRFSAIEALV
jgi:hypothetical protein